MSEDSWRTHRLELDDQTLRDWDAAVLAAGPDGIVLDQSAFYPGGGGQPPTTVSCSGAGSRPHRGRPEG
jgi:misacylated tRNA(Ala) deacylase